MVVAVGSGCLIWYGFYTPRVYFPQEIAGKTMGTDYVVKVVQFPETGDWKKIAAEIQSKLDTLDQMLSVYRQDSEVCRFNAFSFAEEWFPVSLETAHIVETSLAISWLTDGAFDITAFPIVRLWGLETGKEQDQGKSYEELKSASLLLKEHTGYQKLSVRIDPPALKKAIPELAIDPSALVQGFGMDCIAELLDEQKISDYFIEIGDAVRCKGKNGKKRDWCIGIEKPTLEFSGIQQTLALKNQSLAREVSYRQTIRIDDQYVSHLIDPRIGFPSQIGKGIDEMVSVSVIESNGTRASALATALFVLGKQKGTECADQHGIAVLFLLKTGNEIHEIPSKRWLK